MLELPAPSPAGVSRRQLCLGPLEARFIEPLSLILTASSVSDLAFAPQPVIAKMFNFIESHTDVTPLAHLYRYAPASLVNVTAVASVLVVLVGAAAAVSQKVRDALVFSYTCFLQPLGKTANQAERLDKFYQNQANGKSRSAKAKSA